MYDIQTMRHPQFKSPPPNVGPKHPLKNKDNHDKLMEYLTCRLQAGKVARDGQLHRWQKIDKSYIGWLKLSKEDRERLKKEYLTGEPQATRMNLPIMFIQIDDMLSYFLSVFAPGRKMFYQTAAPDEQEAVGKIVTIFNNHAIHTNYFRQVAHAGLSILKYNIGGFCMEWDKETGPQLNDANGDELSFEQEAEVWAGNRVTALDMYNTLFDPLVDVCEFYREGEWAATVELKSHHWLLRRLQRGELFSNELIQPATEMESQYYIHVPTQARIVENESSGGNWVVALSDNPLSYRSNAHEVINMYIRLVPYEFGLNDSKEFSIWKITVLNGSRIIGATQATNVHGHIPFYFGAVNDDNLGRAEKSVAEFLKPLQSFANFLMNHHVRSSRKNLAGLTVYDQTVVDLSKIPEGETVARIPANPTATGRNIRESIFVDNGNGNTTETMQNLESTLGLLNQFFPAQAAPAAIADIDRAVNSQVAAVQQGSNRRQQKSANLLDATLFTPMRADMYFNILQYQADNVAITDYRGRVVEVSRADLRQTNLPYVIGQGLRAIDQMVIADKIQQILFSLIQTPDIAQRIDVLGIMNFWTSMMDIDLDMTQFAIQPPQPVEGQVDPNQPVGTERPIVPAVNPQSVSEPIFG